MPHSLASGLGLHCLPLSHKKDARLKGVKIMTQNTLFVEWLNNSELQVFVLISSLK